jgi:6-phosphogluconolactonase
MVVRGLAIARRAVDTRRVVVGRPGVFVFESLVALEEAAAREVARAISVAVARRGAAHVALAGGATPRGLYARLAEEPWRSAIDWRRVRIFFGDERCVPPDHPDSNHAMAVETLLSRVRVPRGAVHRIRGELEPARAAALYERTLRRVLGGATPRFDLALLGMGADGHTASLFPGSPALDERARLAVAAVSPNPPRDRVTLTLRALNAAREVVFLVAGAKKAEAVARVMEESGIGRSGAGGRGARGGRRGRAALAPGVLPASRVRPSRGRLLWLLDSAAASRPTPGTAPGLP